MKYPQTIRVLALKPATPHEIQIAATALKRPAAHILESLNSYAHDGTYSCCPEVTAFSDKLAALPHKHTLSAKSELARIGIQRLQVDRWVKQGAYPSPQALAKIKGWLAK